MTTSFYPLVTLSRPFFFLFFTSTFSSLYSNRYYHISLLVNRPYRPLRPPTHPKLLRTNLAIVQYVFIWFWLRLDLMGDWVLVWWWLTIRPIHHVQTWCFCRWWCEFTSYSWHLSYPTRTPYSLVHYWQTSDHPLEEELMYSRLILPPPSKAWLSMLLPVSSPSTFTSWM